MAWSAKLQSGTGGVQGFNEWELFFNPSTQTAYKITYNIAIGGDAPDVLYHKPDNGAAIPVRANGRNRLIFLELHIPPQASWDEVLDKIAPISRLVNGADSQAIRAQTTGAADNVRVAIKPDGATNTTYFDVLEGFVDTSRAFTSDVAVLNKTAYKVTVALTCKPYGYGDAFTLRNDLASSPHMIEDSDGDNLADGLNLVSAPTPVINTNRWITGGQSQELTTDDTTAEGVFTTSVICDIGTNFVIMVSISEGATGNDPITISATNGVGGSVTSKKHTPSAPTGYDSTYIDSGGFTWYTYSIAATVATSANARIYVVRATADATQNTTFMIDNLYLQINTQTIPKAWASSAALKNRYDPTSTSAATQQQINYLDVWGIAGDVPALVKMTSDLTLASGTRKSFIFNRLTAQREGYNLVDQTQYTNWKNNGISLFSSGTNGAWSDVADAARTHGDYIRFTAAGGTGNGTSIFEFSDRALYQYPHRVFVLCKASSAAITFNYSVDFVGTGTVNAVTGQSKSVTNTGAWEFIDLGIINLTGMFPPDYPSPGTQAQLSMKCSNVPNGATFEYDDVAFFIVDECFGIYKTSDVFSNGDTIQIDSVQKMATSSTTGFKEPALGDIQGMNITPYEQNRYYFSIYEDDNGHVLGDIFATELTIITRTSHLLGTA